MAEDELDKPFPYEKLSREQLMFMVQTIDGVQAYFNWDYENDGLIHKLGVRRFKNATNPSLPILRSDGIIVFEECVFDDFTRCNVKGVRFSDCVFKSWEGYKLDPDGSSTNLYGNKMPKHLWDSAGNYYYPNWESQLLLPSTGSLFVKHEIDARINNHMHAFYRGIQDMISPEGDEKMCRMFEKIWLMKLKQDMPEILNEFMDSLNSKHLTRALELLEISSEDYALYRKVNEKIF